ncbi:hypothetical protein L6R52_36810 [Myxococcota bacterium]|nr:hypothetical protein [Myxococcota bacterium]
MQNIGHAQTDANEQPKLQELETQPKKREYQAPKLTKKKSVARVTLFSGGGATAGGLTAAG